MKRRNKIKPFTYHEYIYYKVIFQKDKYNKIPMLCDVKESYHYKREINNPHDKIFKDVLDDKKEVVTFLNRMLKLERTQYALQEKDLEKYNREFITENFQSIESDVIYKKKDQNIFFLIEQQSTIDCAMPYRILKYGMAIMESAINKKKLRQKNYKLPAIFSFVIYTGNEKWNATNYLIEKQERLLGCKPETFANFQLIDVNDYTNQELLNKEGFLTKAMLLEKAKNYEELEEYLELVIKTQMEERQKKLLQRMIKYVYKNKLDNKKYNKFIQGLQIKQENGGDSMFAEILSKKIDEVFEMEEKVKEKETKVKEKETKVKEQETKVKEKETKVKEQETKVKEQETKVKEQETKVKEQETKVKEREHKVKKREIEILQKKNDIINQAENEMIINMIKNNIDENTILKIINIDKNRLTKIKTQMMVSEEGVF